MVSTELTCWAGPHQLGSCTSSSAISSKPHLTVLPGSSKVMQRLALVSLAAVAVLATAPSLTFGQGGAQSASAPLKIAFINSREILQKTPGYAVAESTYLKEVEGYRTEVQKLQTQLDSAVQAFDQQSIALSPAARQTKQRDLQQMQQRMEQRTDELQNRARQREQELLQPIQSRVQSVIQGLRAELNYSMILDADAAGGLIAAADPSLNITARVPRPSPGSRRSSARVPAICLFLPRPATSPTLSAPALRSCSSRPRSNRRPAVPRPRSSSRSRTRRCWWCCRCCTRRRSGNRACIPPRSWGGASPGRSRSKSGRTRCWARACSWGRTCGSAPAAYSAKASPSGTTAGCIRA